MIQITRRTFGNLARKGRGNGIGVVERRKVRKLTRLFCHGISNLVTAIANLHTPHACWSVDQPGACVIGDIDPIAAFNEGALILSQIIHAFPRVHEMVVVPILGVCVIHAPLPVLS